jgi:hypothetical protein
VLGDPIGAASDRDAAERLSGALMWAKQFARGCTASPEQAALLELALLGLDEPEPRATFERSVDTTALVYAALTGDERPAWRLAGAAALCDLGIRIVDEVADDELGPRWRGTPSAERCAAASRSG